MGVYNVQDGGVWSANSNKGRAIGNYNTFKELYLQNDNDKIIKPLFCSVVRGLMCCENNLKLKFSLLKEIMTLADNNKQIIKRVFLFLYSIVFRKKYSDVKEYLHK